MVEDNNRPKVMTPDDIGYKETAKATAPAPEGSSADNIRKATQTIDGSAQLAQSIDNAVDKGVFLIGKIIDLVAKKKDEPKEDPNADHIYQARSFGEAQQIMHQVSQGQAPVQQAPTPQPAPVQVQPASKPQADVDKALGIISTVAEIKISQEFEDVKVKDIVQKIPKKWYDKTVKEAWKDLFAEHKETAKPIIKEFIEESLK